MYHLGFSVFDKTIDIPRLTSSTCVSDSTSYYNFYNTMPVETLQ